MFYITSALHKHCRDTNVGKHVLLVGGGLREGDPVSFLNIVYISGGGCDVSDGGHCSAPLPCSKSSPIFNLRACFIKELCNKDIN